MNKKFILSPSVNQKVIDKLVSQGLPEILAPLYVRRGIEDLSPQPLIGFSQLLNIKKACEILEKHVFKNKNKICIVADYDADGATSCVIGLLGLKKFGANIEYMVPNRFIHGYGLTASVVNEVYEKHKPDLIITVDNGVASFEGVDRANELGIEVLVTDHHLQGEELPNAACIVNPNQKACSFPSKNIAGCGVIFYVLLAFSKFCVAKNYYTQENVPNIYDLLDLVAIGTVADVVRLDTNNRILVKLGLGMIQKGKTRPGIKALADVAGKDLSKLNTIDIGFTIGPRINAAGRLEDMSIGISCLMETDIKTAKEKAVKLDAINQERKKIGYDMNDVSLSLMKEDGNCYSKVVYDSSFHEGVIGIVASKIKEKYYAPTIVFAASLEDKSVIKGSGRSIPEIHLRDAIDYVHKKDPSIIIKFGGHAMAAGVTLHKDKLPDFKILFEEAVGYFSNNQLFENVREVDCILGEDFLTVKNVDILNSELWGQGFPSPLFTSTYFIEEQIILKDKHLKLKGYVGNKFIEAIWFFHSDYIEKQNVDLVYTLSINEFNGNRKVQLLVEGIL